MSKFKWIWIPEEVSQDTTLSAWEKIILWLLNWLSKKLWESSVSDSWISWASWIPERTISRYLSKLEKSWYIEKIWKWPRRKIQIKNIAKTANIKNSFCESPPPIWEANIAKSGNSYNIYNKNKKINNIWNLNFICEYWESHDIDLPCNCYKKYKISHFWFQAKLKQIWYKFKSYTEITRDMREYYINNFITND